jgi:hypothetical protein
MAPNCHLGAVLGAIIVGLLANSWGEEGFFSPFCLVCRRSPLFLERDFLF